MPTYEATEEGEIYYDKSGKEHTLTKGEAVYESTDEEAEKPKPKPKAKKGPKRKLKPSEIADVPEEVFDEEETTPIIKSTMAPKAAEAAPAAAGAGEAKKEEKKEEKKEAPKADKAAWMEKHKPQYNKLLSELNYSYNLFQRGMEDPRIKYAKKTPRFEDGLMLQKMNDFEYAARQIRLLEPKFKSLIRSSGLPEASQKELIRKYDGSARLEK